MPTLELLWFETAVSQRMATFPAADPYALRDYSDKKPQSFVKPADIAKPGKPMDELARLTAPGAPSGPGSTISDPNISRNI